ncbi:MAG TPA: DUF92 domain-containing protein [Thermoanaerobaculia bacterium]|nr:DUF92 domain-containing protein [Thermoanaerobaculia bacterium]
MTPAEWKRKAVHAGMGLFALALRWLDGNTAAVFAAAALAFNVWVMPKIGRSLYRPELPRRHDPGIVSYPAVVLGLLLVFGKTDLPLVACVWAMMAFGDPAAAIAGRTVGGPALPWNRDKTWVGLLADAAVACATSLAVFAFVAARAPGQDTTLVLLGGASVFAFLESVRSGLDDNVVAALPTALLLYWLNGHWPPPVQPGAASSWGALAVALAVNVAVAAAMGASRVVRPSGAVAGAIAGFVILAAGGWRAYGVLWAFFLLGTLATRLGYRHKAEAGTAQADQGRRGAAHVAANCLVPGALLVLGLPAAAFAAAFGAALADTLGTEVGTLYGRRAFSPLTFQALPPGTPGAISLPGTAAAVLGAALVAAAAGWLGLLSVPAAAVAALGGFLGALSESWLNDFGRRAGFALDHEFANALNTFIGAMVALRLGVA